MPDFVKGEKGAHKPNLEEKSTKAPSWHTEASLLRAMETAGKQVDDEEMRDLMKENGIGRPSTRAAVIETLFRRKYIIKQKKKLVATPMGVQLIETIQTHLNLSSDEALKRSINLLEEVGIENATKRIEDYPHQFSGGMRQRVAIALAIALRSDIFNPSPQRCARPLT